MQLYAPTTLAPARDFWLLRYTSVMEDGSLVVCERSLNNTQNGPSMPPVQHFVRAELLPSGYLIRPCEGGGSIIHIVDHMDLEVFILLLPKFELLDETKFFRKSLHIYFILALSSNCPHFQPWSVPEVLRPLYESSTLLSQRTTLAVQSSSYQIVPFLVKKRKKSWYIKLFLFLGSTPIEADLSRNYSA